MKNKKHALIKTLAAVLSAAMVFSSIPSAPVFAIDTEISEPVIENEEIEDVTEESELNQDVQNEDVESQADDNNENNDDTSNTESNNNDGNTEEAGDVVDNETPIADNEGALNNENTAESDVISLTENNSASNSGIIEKDSTFTDISDADTDASEAGNSGSIDDNSLIVDSVATSNDTVTTSNDTVTDNNESADNICTHEICNYIANEEKGTHYVVCSACDETIAEEDCFDYLEVSETDVDGNVISMTCSLCGQMYVSNTAVSTLEDDPVDMSNYIVAERTDYGVTWSIDENGLLRMSGTAESISKPWLDYSSDITSVYCDVVTNYLSGYFKGLSKVTNIAFGPNFSTENVEDISYMFYDCKSLTTIDVSGWDVSNVKSMSDMFFNCKSLTTLNVSGWTVSNVKDMSGMFFNCMSLTTLDVSGWNTGNVTGTSTSGGMSSMFSYCELLTTLNVSGWTVSNVKNMSGMFNGCTSLNTLDVSGWDVSNVENMSGMFQGCTLLTSLNVSNWNVGKVTGKSTSGGMSSMFSGCKALTTLDVSGWTISNVKNMSYMFNGCTSLNTLDVSGWDVSNVENMSGMFEGCTLLTSLNVSNWNVGKVTGKSTSSGMSSMFSGCKALTTLDVSGWTISNVKNMSRMFYGCTSLNTLDVSGWDVSNVENMSGMFEGCKSLTTLDASGWNVSNVTNMSYMFNGATITNLNISNWNMSNVTTITNMFRGLLVTNMDMSNTNWTGHTKIPSFCDLGLTQTPVLETVNMSGVYAPDVTAFMEPTNALASVSMANFHNIPSLKSVDLSNAYFPNVTSLKNAFYNDKSLESVDFTGITLGDVNTTEGMFYNTTNLTGIDKLQGFADIDMSDVTTIKNMFNLSGLTGRVDCSVFDWGNVTEAEAAFYSTPITILDVSTLNGTVNAPLFVGNNTVRIHFNDAGVTFTGFDYSNWIPVGGEDALYAAGDSNTYTLSGWYANTKECKVFLDLLDYNGNPVYAESQTVRTYIDCDDETLNDFPISLIKNQLTDVTYDGHEWQLSDADIYDLVAVLSASGVSYSNFNGHITMNGQSNLYKTYAAQVRDIMDTQTPLTKEVPFSLPTGSSIDTGLYLVTGLREYINIVDVALTKSAKYLDGNGDELTALSGMADFIIKNYETSDELAGTATTFMKIAPETSYSNSKTVFDHWEIKVGSNDAETLSNDYVEVGIDDIEIIAVYKIKEYNISVDYAGLKSEYVPHGTVVPNVTKAAKDVEVYITETPEEGYTVYYYRVYDKDEYFEYQTAYAAYIASGKDSALNPDNLGISYPDSLYSWNNYDVFHGINDIEDSFTMPENDVVIVPEFTKSHTIEVDLGGPENSFITGGVTAVGSNENFKGKRILVDISTNDGYKYRYFTVYNKEEYYAYKNAYLAYVDSGYDEALEPGNLGISYPQSVANAVDYEAQMYFKMPDCDVVVATTWWQAHTVEVDYEGLKGAYSGMVPHGTLQTDCASACKGDDINFTITTDDGYSFSEFYVYSKTGYYEYKAMYDNYVTSGCDPSFAPDDSVESPYCYLDAEIHSYGADMKMPNEDIVIVPIWTQDPVTITAGEPVIRNTNGNSKWAEVEAAISECLPLTVESIFGLSVNPVKWLSVYSTNTTELSDDPNTILLYQYTPDYTLDDGSKISSYGIEFDHYEYKDAGTIALTKYMPGCTLYVKYLMYPGHDDTIVPVFVPIKYNIETENSANGSVTINGNDNSSAVRFDELEIIVTPNAGYEVAKITLVQNGNEINLGTGTPDGNGSNKVTYCLENAGDATVKVTYKQVYNYVVSLPAVIQLAPSEDGTCFEASFDVTGTVTFPVNGSKLTISVPNSTVLTNGAGETMTLCTVGDNSVSVNGAGSTVDYGFAHTFVIKTDSLQPGNWVGNITVDVTPTVIE